MPFVSTLLTARPELHPQQDGSGIVVAIPIGYDDETGHDFSMIVGLDLLPGGTYEAFFYILQSFDGEIVRKFWSGKDTDFVSAEDRSRILERLEAAMQAILTRFKPDRIEMTTFDEALPARALQKYEVLLRIFGLAGYSVTTCDPYHGRRLWLLRLES